MLLIELLLEKLGAETHFSPNRTEVLMVAIQRDEFRKKGTKIIKTGTSEMTPPSLADEKTKTF